MWPIATDSWPSPSGTLFKKFIITSYKSIFFNPFSLTIISATFFAAIPVNLIQVGASLDEEDKNNTPAHRVKVGQEPALLEQLKQSAPFHKYFPSGTGDLYAFDQTYEDHLDALLDIIEGAFALE